MILTGTEAEESLLESYNIPASRFSRKPIELSRFNDVVNWLEQPRRSSSDRLSTAATAGP